MQPFQDSLSRGLGEGLYRIKYKPTGNSFWNTTSTLMALTRDDFEDVNANWTCAGGGKINAVVSVFYAGIQGASEVTGTTRRPVCSDGGSAIAVNGVATRALDAAMHSAVGKMDAACAKQNTRGGKTQKVSGGKDCSNVGLKWEWEK